jgi:hypothetical protein
MRTGLRGARGVAAVLLAVGALAAPLALAGCGGTAAGEAVVASTTTGTAAGTPIGTPIATGTASATRTATATGTAGTTGAPARYATAEQLSAAVVAAVRARGSVLITTTARGTPLVSRRTVQLAPSGQNIASQLTFPGQADESLLIVAGVPYVSVSDDALGRHWMQMRFEELAASKTWASAVYAVDLTTELDSWRLAIALSGGDAGVEAGESVRTYTLTLGPQAAAAQVRLDRVATADRPAVAERLARMQYDLTVSVGADDLPRTITTVAPASGLTTTQTYSGWGTVSVAAPDAADVVRS